jgi:hypothetical protein
MNFMPPLHDSARRETRNFIFVRKEIYLLP